MISWREVVAHIATDIENHYDHLKARLNERMKWEDPIQIVPYLGHGTREWLYLKGRVLEDKGISDPKDDDSIWLNLVNMYKRYATDEIAGAKLRATFGTMPSFSPRSKYAGSPPSTHTTTTGRLGQR